jgi:hypothetical protein
VAHARHSPSKTGVIDIEDALVAYNRERQRAGDWAVSRSREFGTCINAEISHRAVPPAEAAARSERVFREYATLHHEVRDWAAEALDAA